ncbi:enoyl-CoA hydratase/isomerase family protein [Sporosarcina siberiensis]|uniref:Enoyl-CoA hydratase/isomerase family protein n=1 Tax=Sporosarcina siberiensis TaxID=1365606 RepID=A0ABW4SIG3_9BACL
MLNSLTDELQVERNGSIVTLWMNRPEVSNALNRSLQKAIIETLKEIDKDESITCVVLRGRGNVFSSGQDGTETKGMGGEEARIWISEIEELYDSIRNLSKVSIAAVEGMAAAASLQIAMLCDLRIVTSSTKLQMQELKMGIPCIAGTSLLIPMIGEARARQLVFEAKPISAETALSWGLVGTVATEDKFEETLNEMCTNVNTLGPLSVKVTKAWFRELSETNFRKALQKSGDLHSDVFASGEAYSL